VGEGASFEIVLAHLDGYARVKLRGELDYPAIANQREAIEEIVGLRSIVVIDLSELTFADSAGLAILARIAGAHDGPVRIEGLTDAVRRLLDMTGLADLFEYTGSG
jgi:anti-anti-sigma factor